MFGYIKPRVPVLKVCEYELYKAHYCGVCKCLGKRYGELIRLSLSYDFAFLSILYTATLDGIEPVLKQGCIANPLKKKPVLIDMRTAPVADTAVIMLYYKLIDNWNDEGFIKKITLLPLFPTAYFAFKKAKKAQPEIEQIVATAMQKQRFAEQNPHSIDEVCHSTSHALGEICRVLMGIRFYKFGYMMGRFVYLCDALDDKEKDEKSKSFNPCLIFGDMQVQDAINLTINTAVREYDKLKLIKNNEILCNIVHCGLRDEITRIVGEKKHD